MLRGWAGGGGGGVLQGLLRFVVAVVVAGRCFCGCSLDDGSYLIIGQVLVTCPSPEKLSTCLESFREIHGRITCRHLLHEM